LKVLHHRRRGKWVAEIFSGDGKGGMGIENILISNIIGENL